MPELPEVEVVRAGLEPALLGSIITSVEVFEPRSLKRHDASLGGFEQLVTGATPKAVVRRGKFLWIPLDDEHAIVAHLGMSGQMLLRAPGHAEDGLLRVRFTIEHSEHGELWWHFVDQRIFGSLAVDRLLPLAGGSQGAWGGFAGAHASDGAWRGVSRARSRTLPGIRSTPSLTTRPGLPRCAASTPVSSALCSTRT